MKFQVGDRVIFKTPLPGSRRTCGEVTNVQKGSPVVHVKVRGRGEYSVPETFLYLNDSGGDDSEPILPQGGTPSRIDFHEVPATSIPPNSDLGL